MTLTADETAAVVDAGSPEEAYEAFVTTLNARGGVEYTTYGHTAADVPLYAFGAGLEFREGVIDITAVGEWLAQAMSLELPEDQRGGGLNTVSGGEGDDVLRGTDGDDLAAGGPGNDRVSGGAGDDELAGGDWDDRLRGRSGDDVLSGGAGDNRLRGGERADAFVFAEGAGSDRVVDFAAGEDVMRFEGEIFADFDAYAAASVQSGGDALVSIDDAGQVRLEGTEMGALWEGDLLFG